MPLPIKIYFKSLLLQLAIAAVFFIIGVVFEVFIDPNGWGFFGVFLAGIECLFIGTVIITIVLTFSKKYDIKLWQRILITALSPGVIISVCFTALTGYAPLGFLFDLFLT
jgi:hypothetical protein